jgi:alpha-beta hydrolase superfamily lysophospholipase
MTQQDWSIPGADDQPIYGTTHLPANGSPTRGVMIICHGFKGYKDYGFFPRLAHAATGCGLVAHRFNFSHSGVTPDYSTFARPDLFELDTWGKQIDDLQTVSAAVAGGVLPGSGGDPLPAVWFGHSRGGVTVLLTAARVFDGQSKAGVVAPAKLIAAATPLHSLHLGPELIHRLRHRGYIESPSSRTGQILRVGKPWLEEIESNPKAFDPLAAIGHVQCPVLLIHGDADTTVPADDARQLFAGAGEQANLAVIPDASHTFNAPNPLPLDQEPPPATRQMIERCCQFIAE